MESSSGDSCAKASFVIVKKNINIEKAVDGLKFKYLSSSLSLSQDTKTVFLKQRFFLKRIYRVDCGVLKKKM